MHEDIDIGYCNYEIKGNARPFPTGISTDIGVTNKWVKNIYIHAKLKLIIRGNLRLKVSPTHKEVRDSAKIRHCDIVKYSME